MHLKNKYHLTIPGLSLLPLKLTKNSTILCMLHLLYGGGYSEVRSLKLPDYSHLHSYEIDINMFENQFLSDYEHYEYLIKHPEMEDDREITNDLVNDRFAIILYYYHSNIESEKKWAMTRIYCETAPYIKFYFRMHRIGNDNEYLYTESLMDAYYFILKVFNNFKNNIRVSTFLNLNLLHITRTTLYTEIYQTTSHYSKKIRDVEKAIQRCEDMGIDNPTLEEIALEAGMSVQQVEDILLRKLVSIKALLEESSLRKRNKEDDEDKYADNYANPESIYISNEKHNALMAALNELDETTREIITYNYGMNSKNQCQAINLKDIGKLLNISYDEVRKKFRNGINKLNKNIILTKIILEPKRRSVNKENSITKKTAISKFFSDIDNDDDIIIGKKPDDDSK